MSRALLALALGFVGTPLELALACQRAEQRVDGTLELTQGSSGGAGLLLGGVPGTPAAKVTIIGGGKVMGAATVDLESIASARWFGAKGRAVVAASLDEAFVLDEAAPHVLAVVTLTLDDRSRQDYAFAFTGTPLREALPGDGAHRGEEPHRPRGAGGDPGAGGAGLTVEPQPPAGAGATPN